ncbi:xanthine dehydrogenase FAD-binding subunit XdhB [Clostridium botulinum]|uniref:Xanthine dehydrogenase family protein, FAD-binding subunit n=1 Tax=Clostridium botulinum (strain Langeland / NCTC 10281 / Type F) TaxID=441772 RepID=A7GCX6_CLOBL|nr:xanthine dehydrogenase FAD-binding subunit XdhB [Clostridium botulinum]ABS41472.1 xanthine dehydrogenase family protein, FAD-binding subunit [Clostridium botulinum F str. Langeland]ADF99090.1 xanthine dehydrogenase family protein, FAD-binding subunit [Clostridium botulinum F str. 230613]KKM43353.1 xanthine dehydrogenase [Clostridium botulinum]MBY6791131.1 xanthine dehydrogenase FAD-binding subunit XdhB [Clostridium botulinum]MBY6936362.1 xanthine dehydrogenase FAD-binding subunit XdhB [Clos
MYDINEILEPKTLEKALELLSEHDNLTVIAGGTDVLVKLHEERFNSLNLISIRNIEGLNEIKVIENDSIEIGAMATFSEIFRDDIVNKNIPILAEAAVSMGGPQIRNMATIGGNICNGAVSGDSAPSLFALNSKLRLKSKNGERIVKIKDFYIGPGQVSIRKDEILISIIIEKKDYENKYGNYIKFASRNAMDIALMGVAVLVEVKNKKFEDLRIALGVSGPTPIRCEIAEAEGKHMKVTDENIRLIGNLALKSSKAIDFWNASKEFKEHLIQELTYRGLKESVKRAENFEDIK